MFNVNPEVASQKLKHQVNITVYGERMWSEKSIPEFIPDLIMYTYFMVCHIRVVVFKYLNISI